MASPVELVRLTFDRIAAARRPEIWICLRDERAALRDAAGIEQRLKAGETLPLAGRVVAVKDNIDVVGMPTTAGCPDYAYLPAATAPAVERLERAGAIVIGKTNMDQFATGLVGTRSPYGVVQGSTDVKYISGGSSAGSAVAVALGLVDIGIGTDTAGSGRVPAALNGIVGLKATIGIVPTTGVVPACPDYDCVTVLTRDLLLGCQTLQVMSGPDEDDPRSRRWPDMSALSAPPNPRVVIPRAADLATLSTPYRRAFDAAVVKAIAAGIDVEVANISRLLDVSRLMYDGAIVAQRFAAIGRFLATEPPSANPTVSSIIRNAEAIPAWKYLADAERLRGERAHAIALLDGGSGFLLPTTTEHPTIASVTRHPLSINRRLGTYTNFCNILDMAAVAVPAGEAEGRPFGIMFVVPTFADQVAIDLAGRFLGQAVAPCIIDNGVDLAVFGAHLRGQPLNYELVALGGRYIEDVTTSPAYRFQVLRTSPSKPSLVPVGPAEGAAIRGELWRLSPAALGCLVGELSAPMSLTSITLSDHRRVVGFSCTPDAAAAGHDITEYGGWVAYRSERLK